MSKKSVVSKKSGKCKPRRQAFKIKTKEGKAIAAKLNEIVNKELQEQRRMPREQLNQLLAKLLPEEQEKSIKINNDPKYIQARKGGNDLKVVPKTFWATEEDSEDSEEVTEKVAKEQPKEQPKMEINKTIVLNNGKSSNDTKLNDKTDNKSNVDKMSDLRKLIEEIIKATKEIESSRNETRAVTTGDQVPKQAQVKPKSPHPKDNHNGNSV